MRQLIFGLTIALGVSALTTEARAQGGLTNTSDPFFLYYGFYLPRQQAQALQSGPEASINAITAARQAYASTNRTEMFDPYASSSRLDFESDFLSSGGGRGRGYSGVSQAARHGGNLAGRGVASGGAARFNRVGSYHPTLRSGQSRNANVAVLKGRGSFSGGGGQGAATSGLGVGGIGPR